MSIKLATKKLKHDFVYLGGVISADSSCDKDVAIKMYSIWRSQELG